MEDSLDSIEKPPLAALFAFAAPHSAHAKLEHDGAVFIACSDTDWGAAAGFDQNRLFVGPQWRLDTEPGVVLELGYLNRFKRREAANDVMDHIALLNVFLNF